MWIDYLTWWQNPFCLIKDFKTSLKKTEAVLNDVLPASQSAATSAALTPQRTSNNSDVDKAVKEALSHHENRCSLVISGIEDSKSQAHDACFVTDLFSYLGEKDIAVIDCFRLVSFLLLAPDPHLNHVCSRSFLLIQTTDLLFWRKQSCWKTLITSSIFLCVQVTPLLNVNALKNFTTSLRASKRRQELITL